MSDAGDVFINKKMYVRATTLPTITFAKIVKAEWRTKQKRTFLIFIPRRILSSATAKDSDELLSKAKKAEYSAKRKCNFIFALLRRILSSLDDMGTIYKKRCDIIATAHNYC